MAWRGRQAGLGIDGGGGRERRKRGGKPERDRERERETAAEQQQQQLDVIPFNDRRTTIWTVLVLSVLVSMGVQTVGLYLNRRIESIKAEYIISKQCESGQDTTAEETSKFPSANNYQEVEATAAAATATFRRFTR